MRPIIPLPALRERGNEKSSSHMTNPSRTDASSGQSSSRQIDLILGAPPELQDEIAAILRPNLRCVGLVFLAVWIIGLLFVSGDGPWRPVDCVFFGALIAT